MIAIKIAHMHSSLFMGGSLGKDIDASKKTGMKIWHDINRNLLFIQYKGMTGVAHTWELLEPFDCADYGLDKEGKTPSAVVPFLSSPMTSPHQVAAKAQLENPTLDAPKPRGRPAVKSAQVSTPIDHVHAGPGAGKTRD